MIKEIPVKITRFYFLPTRLTKTKTTGPMLPKRRRKKYFRIMLLFNLSKVSLESINSTVRNLFLGRKRNQTHKVALYDDVHDSIGY